MAGGNIDGYLHYVKKQNNIVTPSVFKRGIISAIHTSSFTGDVQIVGNSSSIIKSVPFASHVNASAVNVGDKCMLWQFDETNPNDQIILAIYGRNFRTSAWGFKSGTISVISSGTNISIPHTLGVIPTFATVSSNILVNMSASGYQSIGVYVSATGPNNVPFDATNIYATVIMNASGNFTYDIFWFASIAM
jgi:hypothetical protein